MNIEEIEESKKCLNEIIQNTYAEGKAIKLDNLRKYIQELEQKESILDKVTEECRKQMTTYEDSILEIFPGKLLNIIEGEKE